MPLRAAPVAVMPRKSDAPLRLLICELVGEELIDEVEREIAPTAPKRARQPA